MSRGKNICVGILTLHHIPNYGAVLQSYALQKYLEKFVEVELVDYRQCDRECNFSNWGYWEDYKENKSIKKLLRYPVKRFRNRYAYRLRSKLENFYFARLKLSERIFLNDISRQTAKYDAIIVGSDQVWNPKVLNGKFVLLLDFYKGNKFSYASSIGVKEFPLQLSAAYKDNLSKFTMLSCREQAGTDAINELLGANVCERVLDPTLLLTQEEWHSFAQEPLKPINNYILVYTVKYDKKIIEAAGRYAAEKSMKLKVLATPMVYARQKELHKIDCDYCISPEEWVWYFEHAERIITNSFHGVAFSVNLGKQVIIRMEDALDVNKTNSRLENIISMFGLEKNVLQDTEDMVDVEADYKKIHGKLALERSKSQLYLDKVINTILQ